MMMDRNFRVYLPSILNVLTAGAAFFLSFIAGDRIPISSDLSKQLAYVLVFIGMALVLWAALHIRGAFLGEVEPRLDKLVQNGPYRFVRHPVYLGMTIALSAVPVALRSWLGLIAVFGLFLPSDIYRAKLEEKALLRAFGSKWQRYADRTGFMLPRIR